MKICVYISDIEKQNYIGRKVKGFSFDDGVHKVGYSEEMEKYIGVNGEIMFYSTDYLAFKVMFEDGNHWFYPASLIDQYLVPEESNEIELRDQFAMQALNALIIAHKGTYAEIYDESYSIADKMLKARKEVKGE